MSDYPPGPEREERHFDALFRAHYADLYRYALRRCVTSEDAEDLVAETFAVAWRRRGGLPDGNEARLWLFGTARLLRMNQLRSMSRQRALVDRIRSWGSRFQRRDVADGIADRSRIGKALAALADTDREVLLLVAWEGLSSTEVATVLDISSAAARKRLERARIRFREEVSIPTAPKTATPLTAKEARR